MDLFNYNGAIFSDDRKYRYVLYRTWEESKPRMLCIGLNPSNADESADDLTIRRLRNIANDQGFGGLIMINLFALVTSYPKELLNSDDPIGDNDKWIKKTVNEINTSGIVVLAWGSFKEAKDRAKEVLSMIGDRWCFDKNKDGSPKHPLYLPRDIKPIPYT